MPIPSIALLALQYALQYGIPAGLKIAEFWKASATKTVTPQDFIDLLTDIQGTVDDAISAAEKRAGLVPGATATVAVTGTVQ